ncbi:MAG TPA: ABC transporter permease [Blastocatellia bacterium]|nr:ABC transporter permease [Blastocatellia bacterium]
METLIQDLRYGIRMMFKNRSFTLVAIVTLALGIGANTAIFSVVDAVLLRSVPYPDAGRLVMLWSTMQSQGLAQSGSALPDYREWRDQNHVFEGLGGFYYGDFNLSGERQEPERVQGAFVTPNFFSVLGVAPAIGRGFLPEEDQFGRHRVVLLSYGLWERRYAANPEIVGQTIDLGGEPCNVAGVMPQGMAFLDNTPPVELWRPISFPSGDNMDSRNNHFVYLIGRLKPGVEIKEAQADASSIAANIEAAHPENDGVGAEVVLLSEQLTGDTRTGLLVLLGAVGFVLLVACVNVANLLLARAASREKELAVRTSLGASRGRLVRQLMLESVPLGLLGGGAGLLLAMWGVDAIVTLLPATIPRFNRIGIDSHVLVFTFGVSLLTITIFGLLPAFQATKSDVREALGDGGRSVTAGRRRSRLRGVLVASEMALALVLLIGAGLMAQSFLKLRNVDAGFSPKNVLTMGIPLPESKYPVPATITSPPPVAINFYDQLLARVAALPGVESAGVSTVLPLGAGRGWGKFFSVEGRPAPASLDQVPLVRFGLTSHGYLRAMGIAVRRGRAFTEHDTADSQQVAIVNETLARRFFADEDPIGKTIWMGPPENLLPPDSLAPINRFVRRTIVGVVADVKGPSLEKSSNPEVLAPYLQSKGEGWFNSLMLAVRTTTPAQNVIGAVREEVLALDSRQPITNVATMEERLSRSLSQPRFSTLLLGLFAFVALLLAAVGIFGVMSYVVTQRTHEIGIRMALGAQRFDVLKLVVGHGMRLTLIGLAIGLTASFLLTRVMSSLLFGVSATDPLTFVAISLLLAGVALAACYLPARRATKVDPMVALRYE